MSEPSREYFLTLKSGPTDNQTYTWNERRSVSQINKAYEVLSRYLELKHKALLNNEKVDESVENDIKLLRIIITDHHFFQNSRLEANGGYSEFQLYWRSFEEDCENWDAGRPVDLWKWNSAATLFAGSRVQNINLPK